MAKKYGAEQITVLEGLEPVRKRPGMYIGSTGPDGLHHLVWEIFDNARDEAMAGAASEIEVVLLPDNVVRVADNGRGIPVEVHAKTKVSALETVMTTLHAGGKFDSESYTVSGGLHGVGASVVNALSEWLSAEVHRDGGKYLQEYARGKKKGPVKRVGASRAHGTIIAFTPDPQVFPSIELNWQRIVSHLRQQAYLVKDLRIRAIDARACGEFLARMRSGLGGSYYFSELGIEAPSETFCFDSGLLSLIKFYNRGERSFHKNIFFAEKESGGVYVEVALQYIDDMTVREVSFANNTSTPEGGMHLTGFRTALTRVLNDYARKNGLIKESEDNFSGEDVREGMTAVVSVKLQNPQFEGQTKAKLGSVEARGAVESVFGDAFGAFLEEHPDDARSIIGKVSLALKARKAARAAKESVLRKGALDGLTLPGKLADCQSNSAEESELFVVEGDSAGGSSKQGRNRRIQAVLPLKGKILNVERARIDQMLDFKEIKSLVIALGTAIGDTFDLSKLRYHKIIMATDADVDGAHIRTLLMTLFYRHLRPIVENGHLYVAQPPLFKIHKGKETRYAYSDEERDEIIREMGLDIGGENVQRYKGLGEMNPDELWETTMDPDRRMMKRVTVEDAEEADRTFSILMGNDVLPRKLFIQSHAKLANLDV